MAVKNAAAQKLNLAELGSKALEHRWLAQMACIGKPLQRFTVGQLRAAIKEEKPVLSALVALGPRSQSVC